MNPSARRIVGLVAVAILVAVGCTVAGFWQWHRGEDRERAVDTLRANFSADPVPLTALLDSPTAHLEESETWRPSTLTGQYLPDSTVLLRNRPVAGHPSFHLLVPFEITEPGSSFDGTILVIDRGWVPIGTDATGEIEIPEPPSGTVTVEVRVRPAERAATRTAPAGQSHSIFPEQVLAASAAAASGTGEVVAHAYGGLITESPPPAVTPGTLPVPSTDYGPHRSYAMQWWMFAFGALVGFGMLAWRERRVEDEDPADDGAAQVVTPPAPRRRRRPTAEEEEDALIDAQASETRSR